MFRKAILTLGAGIALSAQPVLAQDDAAADAEALASMMQMFAAEPLTAEQESRLPLAEEVVSRILPEGALGEMMGSMFDGMLKPLMEMETKPSAANVADQLGVSTYSLDLEDVNAAEAIAILDPAWNERKKIEADMMPSLLAEMMNVMEPTMRKALAEIHAVHFTTKELNDINAFFKTESGANYAKKSFTMATDPRIISASMEGLPDMMGAIATMTEKMEAATADLPEPRGYDDLDANERARLAELIGMSESELAAEMADSAAMAAAMMEAVDAAEAAVEE